MTKSVCQMCLPQNIRNLRCKIVSETGADQPVTRLVGSVGADNGSVAGCTAVLHPDSLLRKDNRPGGKKREKYLMKLNSQVTILCQMIGIKLPSF
jgi:hypothetical protein